MNPKLLANLTAVATAATALVSVSAPAQAFSFGTNGISFTENTQVDFTFLSSHSSSISSLGIYEVNGVNAVLKQVLFSKKEAADPGFTSAEKGWLGTAQNLTGAGQVSYEFLAGTVYTLGLFSKRVNSEGVTTSILPMVYSTSALNNGQSQQAVFGSSGSSIDGQEFTTASNYQSGNPFDSPLTISFEGWAGPGTDNDFNDVTIQAQAVPEPLTMGGLALGIGGMVVARRRRHRNAV